VDSPLHRVRGGTDLAGLPLERVAHVPVRVFDARDLGRAIGPELFAGADLEGAAVLVRTDFSRHWRTAAYGRDNPFLTAEASALLAGAGVAFVGIDSLNIDDTESGGTRPAHSILLAAGVHVVEHLTALDRVPVHGARFTAVPPRVEGFGTFPVRAFVELPVTAYLTDFAHAVADALTTTGLAAAAPDRVRVAEGLDGTYDIHLDTPDRPAADAFSEAFDDLFQRTSLPGAK